MTPPKAEKRNQRLGQFGDPHSPLGLRVLGMACFRCLGPKRLEEARDSGPRGESGLWVRRRSSGCQEWGKGEESPEGCHRGPLEDTHSRGPGGGRFSLEPRDLEAREVPGTAGARSRERDEQSFDPALRPSLSQPEPDPQLLPELPRCSAGPTRSGRGRSPGRSEGPPEKSSQPADLTRRLLLKNQLQTARHPVSAIPGTGVGRPRAPAGCAGPRSPHSPGGTGAIAP
ncbi:uncharacterized protein LOC100012097 isoform X5 [Monodelphis domestica]|uniref:uncharacterized protein LOC100012097 isoform X5 n=1 Tax=Monodelphis domestica TaxID=13616 RepID=UPI0024E273B7|nr:uncharacterized protein LOC100012097 isoform X5 [Monodelphis domestica]